MNQVVNFESSLTMSSLEIAELCEKQHKHVMVDIRNMLEALEIDSAEFSAQYKDSTGRSLPCFNLPKDLTLTLVSGYNVKLRHRIVARLEELEGRAQPPQLSRLDLIQIAMDAEKERLKLEGKTQEQQQVIEQQGTQIQELAPKAKALDRIATADGSLCITDTAKHLQIRPKDLFAWLSAHQWIYRRPGCGNWIAYQNRLQRGVLEHKITTISRSDGTEKTKEQVRVTPKGLALLADVFASAAA